MGIPNALRIALAISLIVIALPAAIFARIFFNQDRDCSADEFASRLERLALGSEGPYDWDELESEPLQDPRLEEIRQAAMALAFPPSNEDRAILRQLAARARG
jgi:uncharacterized protein YciW